MGRGQKIEKDAIRKKEGEGGRYRIRKRGRE
jgi:hypothetical protein